MDTSIVIINWNTRDILRNCLASVYAQTKGVGFEVIVIDNASTDNSTEMVKTEFPKVILLQNDTNRGFAAANNQGIAIARGRYVLLLNSDTVILGEAISRSVQFADAQPEAAVVGCRVLNPDKTLQMTCFMFPSILNMFLSCTYLYKLFPRNKFFGRERMTWWDREDVRQVDVVTGCFMLVRRQAIEEVGVMDERFFMYGEETDWCYRFKQAGWKVVFTPDGEIIHLGGQSSKKVRRDMIIRLRLSILGFIRKHHNRAYHLAACILTAVFFAVRLPGWLFLSIFGGQRRKTALTRFRAYLNGAGKALWAVWGESTV